MDFISYVLHGIGTDLSRGDYFGASIGIAVVLALLATVAAILYGIFYLLDTAFVPHRTCSGTVTGKTFVDGWTQHINNTDANGHVTSTTQIHHPAQFNVHVAAPGVSGSVNVGVDAYGSYHTNQPVTIWYRVGRISGSSYVTGIGGR